MGQPWSAFANACRRIRARPSPISAFAVPRTSSATPKRSPRSLWDAAPMSMRPTKRRVAKPVPPRKGLLPGPNIYAASVEASTAVSTEPPSGRGSVSAPTTCKSFCNSTEPRPLRRARCSSSTSSRSPWLAHSPQCIGLHSVTAPGPLPVTRAPAHGRDRTGLTDIDADALQHLVRRANFLPYLPYGSSHDLSIQGKISRYYLPTIVCGRVIWHLGYTEEASTTAFTLSYGEFQRAASLHEPSYRVRGVLTDGFDSTIKSM